MYSVCMHSQKHTLNRANRTSTISPEGVLPDTSLAQRLNQILQLLRRAHNLPPLGTFPRHQLQILPGNTMLIRKRFNHYTSPFNGGPNRCSVFHTTEPISTRMAVVSKALPPHRVHSASDLSVALLHDFAFLCLVFAQSCDVDFLLFPAFFLHMRGVFVWAVYAGKAHK